MTSRNLLLRNRFATSNNLVTYPEFIKTISLFLYFTSKEGTSAISQTDEQKETAHNFRCPNVSCHRTFAKPLKASNLQKQSGEPYDACPYCLTEITVDDEEHGDAVEQNCAPTVFQNATKSPECKKHLGYLGERSVKEPVPDECMMCTAVVQCMLKKALE